MTIYQKRFISRMMVFMAIILLCSTIFFACVGFKWKAKCELYMTEIAYTQLLLEQHSLSVYCQDIALQDRDRIIDNLVDGNNRCMEELKFAWEIIENE